MTVGLAVGATALPMHGAQAAETCISDGAKKALEEMKPEEQQQAQTQRRAAARAWPTL
mgnify:CR=1 FL=1